MELKAKLSRVINSDLQVQEAGLWKHLPRPGVDMGSTAVGVSRCLPSHPGGLRRWPRGVGGGAVLLGGAPATLRSGGPTCACLWGPRLPGEQAQQWGSQPSPPPGHRHPLWARLCTRSRQGLSLLPSTRASGAQRIWSGGSHVDSRRVGGS